MSKLKLVEQRNHQTLILFCGNERNLLSLLVQSPNMLGQLAQTLVAPNGIWGHQMAGLPGKTSKVTGISLEFHLESQKLPFNTVKRSRNSDPFRHEFPHVDYNWAQADIRPGLAHANQQQTMIVVDSPNLIQFAIHSPHGTNNASNHNRSNRRAKHKCKDPKAPRKKGQTTEAPTKPKIFTSPLARTCTLMTAS